MKKSILFWLLAALSGFVGFSPTTTKGGDSAPALWMSAPTWHLGDSWAVTVEAYSINWAFSFSNRDREATKNTPAVYARYSMRVRVAGAVPFSNRVCWLVDFIPGQDAPADIRKETYRVWVDQSDRQLRRIQSRGGEAGLVSVEKIDGLSMIDNMASGFPLQVLPKPIADVSRFEKNEAGHQLTVAKRPVENGEEIESRLDHRQRDGSWANGVRVVQTWSGGAKWWKSYEMYLGGHLLTRAWLTTNSPGTVRLPAPVPENPK